MKDRSHPLCLHDRRGYFIGRIRMGRIERLSVEHFDSETQCQAAIATRRWRRRRDAGSFLQ